MAVAKKAPTKKSAAKKQAVKKIPTKKATVKKIIGKTKAVSKKPSKTDSIKKESQEKCFTSQSNERIKTKRIASMSLFDELDSNENIVLSPSHPAAALDEEIKQHYVNLVAFVGKANGDYYPTEVAMLERLVNTLGLSQENQDSAVSFVRKSSENKDATIFEAALESWKNHEMREVLFFDMCRIAAADGTICEKERKYLSVFAKRLKLDDKHESIKELACALKLYSADNTKKTFDAIIKKASLNPEYFSFIRNEFKDTNAESETMELLSSLADVVVEENETFQDRSLANSVIRKCQDNILSHLAMLQNILDKCRPKASGKYSLASNAEIEQYFRQIDEEQAKVKQLRMTLAVIGPMKAGKSTLINAIVGAEVLPSRSGAMTTMPTLITHVDGCKEPVLKFPKAEPFNEVIKSIAAKSTRKSGHIEDTDGADYADTLNRIRSRQLTEIRQEYRGEEQIADFMKDLNDLVRISQLPEFELPSPLEHYSQIDDFPEIEVEFISLTNRVNDTLGKLTLVDTPGPNEAGQGHLKGVVKKQLQQAAAIVVVVAPTQKDGEAFAEIRSWVHNARVHNGVPLYVFLNKFDEMRKGERKKENVELLCRSLFPDIPLEDGTLLSVEGCTFPTCAFPALLANKAIRSLENEGILPDADKNPWVLDFAEKVFGQYLADEKLIKGDLREFRAGSDHLWGQSLMEGPLKRVVSASLYRAAPLCLDSAVEKIASTGKFLQDRAKGQRNSLTQSLETLRRTIDIMNDNLAELKKAQKKLQSIAQSAVSKIGGELIKPLDTMLHNTGKIIKDATKEKGQELDDIKKQEDLENRPFWLRLLGGMTNKSQSDNVKKALTGNEVLEFSSQDDAADFGKDLEKIMNKAVGHALQKIVGDLEPIISEEQRKLARDIDAQISPIMKKIGDETKDTFDIDLSPPEVALPKMNLDIDIISCVNINKHCEKKSYTERRWITLGLWKHTVEYIDTVYKVDPKTIRKNLQSMLKDKIEDLKDSVSTFVSDQFDAMMQDYFRGLDEKVSNVRSIAERGIEANKLDQNEKQTAQREWKNTEEELTDFHESVSCTKNILKEAEV